MTSHFRTPPMIRFLARLLIALAIFALVLVAICIAPRLRLLAERHDEFAQADSLCRSHYFDGASVQGGRMRCEVGLPTSDGLSEVMSVPLEDAADYELEAFNVRETKCQPPQEPFVDWAAMHAATRVNGDE